MVMRKAGGSGRFAGIAFVAVASTWLDATRRVGAADMAPDAEHVVRVVFIRLLADLCGESSGVFVDCEDGAVQVEHTPVLSHSTSRRTPKGLSASSGEF